MKATLRILLLIIFILIIYSCKKTDVSSPPNNSNITNDTLPKTDTLNAGMEYWVKTVQNNIVYEEPAGYWATLNPLAKLGAPITVSKTTDKHSGNYAVKLESKLWGPASDTQSLLIPGLLSIGVFITAEPFLVQGCKYTAKPSSLQGYYKYTSIQNDSAVIYAKISKFNQIMGTSDTIAEAKFVIKNTVSSYQAFNINFNYYLPTLTPDTLCIVFVSSGGGQNFKGQVGSTLFIDDIKLTYPTKKKD